MGSIKSSEKRAAKVRSSGGYCKSEDEEQLPLECVVMLVAVDAEDIGDGMKDGVIGRGDEHDPSEPVKDVAEHGESNGGVTTCRST